MSFLKALSSRLGHALAVYGGWGLFGISFFDATVLSFPLLNDLLLIHLASQSPGRALLYALASAAGSVLGYAAVYGAARGGGNLLWRRRSPAASGRAPQWLGRNDFVAILFASLLPPPAPFKPFVAAAGVMRMNFARFCLALAVGRTLRFVGDALLGAHYGASAEAYFRANIGWASLTFAALLAGFTLLYRRLSRSVPETPVGRPGAPSSGPG